MPIHDIKKYIFFRFDYNNTVLFERALWIQPRCLCKYKQYERNMTPGIIAAKKNKISFSIHEYSHDASSESYGHEAAEKMGVPKDRVFKTLVVSLDNKTLAVGIIPVSSMLNLKYIAKATGAKKAIMANKMDVERSTGYVLGGVSPLGQKKQLKTFIDSSAKNYATVYVSAGRRGLEIELSPNDLSIMTKGNFTVLCQ